MDVINFLRSIYTKIHLFISRNRAEKLAKVLKKSLRGGKLLKEQTFCMNSKTVIE